MSAKKKVLVFTSSFPRDSRDASGIFVEDLTRRLADRFNISVLAPQVEDAPLYEERDGMRIYRFRQKIGPFALAGKGGILGRIKKNKFLLLLLPFFLLSQFMSLLRVVRKEKVELIHAHWLLPQGLLAVLCRCCFRRRIRVLVTCHGSDIQKVSGFPVAWLKRWALKHADGVTAVSSHLRDLIEKMGKGMPEVRVAPMGVDTEKFRPDPGSRSGRDGEKVILFVGSLIELKGVGVLIDAMPAVLAAESGAKLILAGTGPLKEEYEARVAALGLQGKICFAGMVPHGELPAYFADSDCFVLPSFSEGWPLVVMEALSTGLPAVVSDLPVFCRHEAAEQLFLIAPRGDSAVLAERILTALEKNNVEEVEFRRIYAREHFDLKKVAERYSAYMEMILS